MTQKNPILDAEAVARIALALDPVTVPDDVRRRARARVLASAAAGLRTTRQDEGPWHRLSPGIEVKLLAEDVDGRSQTCLWRLAPGAEIPRHPHRVGETCLVVEGTIEFDGEVWRTGDYIEVPPGGDHGIVRASTAALLLIRSDPVPGVGHADQGR